MATHTSDLERTDCVMCGSRTTQTASYGLPPFEVVQCAACGLWYLSPRIREAKMKELYAEASYFEGSEGGYADYATQKESLRVTFRKLLDAMSRRDLCGGRLLEVGCGYGYFLDASKPYFERREGTEFSRTAAARASLCADEIYLGGIEALPPSIRYDCIVALQVIEHVYDPVAFVKRLRLQLADTGTLLLSTPNMGSAWRKVLGSRWPSFKLPEHVAFYDSKTLVRLLRQAGFENPRAIPHPHAFSFEEILGKLGLRALGRFAPGWIVIPGTVIALAAGNPRTRERQPTDPTGT